MQNGPESTGVPAKQPPFPRSRSHGPVAVLCSRGETFPTRMDSVAAWAKRHAVSNIMLLHCPEAKYSESFVKEVKKRARELFAETDAKLKSEGFTHMHFECVSRKGLLQDNIEQLIRENTEVSIIFVGDTMLDYTLDDVKRLQVPFMFLP